MSDNTERESQTMARIEIDLRILQKNVSQVRATLGSSVGMIAVVKADAYGHGLVRIAREFLSSGVDIIGVASAAEARALRLAGIDSRILIIYPVFDADVLEMVSLGIELTVTAESLLRKIEQVAAQLGVRANIHIQLETGMHHYGAETADAIVMGHIIMQSDSLTFTALSTHYAAADSDPTFTKSQHDIFVTTLRRMAEEGFSPKLIHTANSAAIDHFSPSWDTQLYKDIAPSVRVCVRTGCLLYGTYKSSNPSLETEYALRSLKTNILEIKHLRKGDRVGYFGVFVSGKDTTIGVLPIGWGSSGFFPESGHALVGGKKVGILSPISANTCVIDLSEVDCRVGDEVVLLGREGEHSITLEVLSQQQGVFINRLIATLGASTERTYIE